MSQTRPICGAKRAKGRGICQSTALYENGRCRNHGGPSLKGIASPSFKDGKHSRYLPHLPKGWVQHYGVADADLVTLTHELELNVMAMRTLLEGIQKGRRPSIATLYKKLQPMLNLHQKLVGVESRRLREQQELVQRSEFARFAQACVLSVAQHVDDPKVKGLIQADVLRFLGLAAPPLLKGDAA